MHRMNLQLTALWLVRLCHYPKVLVRTRMVEMTQLPIRSMTARLLARLCFHDAGMALGTWCAFTTTLFSCHLILVRTNILHHQCQ